MISKRLLFASTTLYLEQERFDQVLIGKMKMSETVVTRWNIARALAALEKTEEAVSAYQELYRGLEGKSRIPRSLCLSVA